MKSLIVHHSASRNGHTSKDAPAILRNFFDFHTGPEKGWNDIAYNFLIDFEGLIWEGRQGSLEGPIAGDATGGNQGFTQLVCIIGDYNAIEPSQPSLDSLVSLLAWLSDRYSLATVPGSEVVFTSRGSNVWSAGASVTTPTITGHQTMSQTTCPGDHLNAYVLGGLMADVAAARVQPTTTTLATTTTTISEPTTTPKAPESPETTPSSTAPRPSTTEEPLPLASDTPGPSGSGAGWLLVGVAGALLSAVAWRFRRMRRPRS